LWAGKGKVSCYFFGMINSFCYGLISYQYQLFGEVMLNWGYYFPMMFVGLFFWRKHLNEDKEIYKEKLGMRGRILLVVISLLAVLIYERVLHHMGDKQSLLDSLTTILSVSAMVMTVKRCIEQWILWIIVNFISIYMWYQVYLTGGPGASLLMWIVALCNSFIFLYQWTKEVKPCPAKTIQP
jgi:nicotinamide mononucleotide transporter